MKENSKSQRREEGIQVSEVAAGEQASQGSESMETNFEKSNINYLKTKAREILSETLKTSETEVNEEDLLTQIDDEIDSLFMQKNKDLIKADSVSGKITNRMSLAISDFAKGKSSKGLMGIRMQYAIEG
jgi:hypothetical protein